MPDFLYHAAVLASLACTFLVVGGFICVLIAWGIDAIGALDDVEGWLE